VSHWWTIYNLLEDPGECQGICSAMKYHNGCKRNFVECDVNKDLVLRLK